MSRTYQFALSTCRLTIAISLLTYIGCTSSDENEKTTSVGNSSISVSNRIAQPIANEMQRGKRRPVVIRGDLNSVDWNSLVGKEVSVVGDLVVVDTFDLIRRGQIKVARNRLFVPTSLIDPNDADPRATSYEGGSNVAKIAQAQKFNDNATIIIDDGTAKENIFPPKLFPKLGKTHPTVRVGSMLKGVTGRLVKAGNNLLLIPNGPLSWSPAERPRKPDIGKADVVIASFNVLNYFTTLDDGTNNARGADSQEEFNRQEAKLVSAILALKADVIGLMEIENNLEAENRLVAKLNEAFGQKVFKGCGIPKGFRDAPGGQDSIRVGIIYRADRVVPVGKTLLIRDEVFYSARTPIIQEFKSKTSGKPFTVIVNHFKSKGGADRADVANKNKGDGQGAYNAKRRSQSLAICKYIDKLSRRSKNPRVLVIGDLNAYEQEDPVDAMRAKGLIDLHEHFDNARINKTRSRGSNSKHYSFLYYGQCGSLDHAMATKSLADDVTGIATWHINADEPRFLDYNQEHNPKSLYKADPFRSSDHDPVLIGIR